MMRIRIPSWATVGLGLLAGVLVALNQVSFGFEPPWHQVVLYGLVAISAFGISPLIGPDFANALHVSHRLMTVITTLLLTVAAAVQTLSISQDAKGIVLGIVTVIGSLGFGSAGAAPTVAPAGPVVSPTVPPQQTA